MCLQEAHNYRYTYTRECCGRRQYGDEDRPKKKCYEGVIFFNKLQDYQYQADHRLFKHV